jgi:hypothetical protein
MLVVETLKVFMTFSASMYKFKPRRGPLAALSAVLALDQGK